VNGEHLVNLVQSVVFFAPLAVIIWNLAKVHTRIENNKASTDRAHTRIDKFEEHMKERTHQLFELFRKVQESQIRMEEKIGRLLRLEGATKE
jgi:hypothetical protein